MRAPVTLLTLLALSACASERASLTHAEARLRLLQHYVTAMGGRIDDVRGLQFSLEQTSPYVREAVSDDGQHLATFRLADDGRWVMTPDAFLEERLQQLAKDRGAVIDLAARVDSAEVAVSNFEAALTGMIRSDHGTEPWKWRLEQAREFLTEMESYVRSLDARAQQLAGARDVWARSTRLLERLRSARAEIDQQLTGR